MIKFIMSMKSFFKDYIIMVSSDREIRVSMSTFTLLMADESTKEMCGNMGSTGSRLRPRLGYNREQNCENWCLTSLVDTRDVRDQGFLVPVPIFFYIEVYMIVICLFIKI